MKKVIIIILLLITLFIGMNLGSQSNDTKAEIIKDQIEKVVILNTMGNIRLHKTIPQ